MNEMLIIIAMLIVVLSVAVNQRVKKNDYDIEATMFFAQIQEDVEKELQETQNNLNKRLAEGKIWVRDQMIKEREDTRLQMLGNNAPPEKIEEVMWMYNRHI